MGIDQFKGTDETVWQDTGETTWDMNVLTLTVNDTLQTTSNDAVATVQENSLVVLDTLQTTSSDNISPALESGKFKDTQYTQWKDLEDTKWDYDAQLWTLSLNDCSQVTSNTSVSPTVTETSVTYTLSITDIVQTTSNALIELAQERAALTISSCSQTTSNDSIAVSFQRSLVVSNSEHHTGYFRVVYADLGGMTFEDRTNLTWDELGVGQAVITPTLETTLELSNVSQTTTSDEIVLLQGIEIVTLVVVTADQATTNDLVATTLETNITLSNPAQATTNDAVVPWQETSIVLSDVAQATTSNEITISDTGTGLYALGLTDSAQATTSDEIATFEERNLTLSVVAQATSSDEISTTHEQTIEGVDAAQTTTNTSIAPWQETFLVASDAAQETTNDALIEFDTTGVTTYTLTILDIIQQNLSDALALAQEVSVALATVFQTTTSDELTDWIKKTVLVVLDIIQTNSVEYPELYMEMNLVMLNIIQPTTNDTILPYLATVGLIKNPSFNRVSNQYGFTSKTMNRQIQQ
jgi:hypothetical protein